MKERQLESLRTTAIQSGLYARCKAMVECGWAWGEMGKEGLRVLEIIGSEAEPQNSNGTCVQFVHVRHMREHVHWRL